MGATASAPRRDPGGFTKSAACLQEASIPSAPIVAPPPLAFVANATARPHGDACVPVARPSFDAEDAQLARRSFDVVDDDVPATDDHFFDSRLVRGALRPEAADALLAALEAIPSTRRTRTRAKYALRTDYYGLSSRTDGALPLDRWGSDFEQWERVAPLPRALVEARDAVLAAMRGEPRDTLAANSVVVNYYADDSVPIAAHADSIASLAEDSPILCLTLGAARDVVITGKGDAGKTADLVEPVATFRPGHGDLFVLGPRTNATFCHCVPASPATGDRLRVSVVFRSVDRSFVRAARPGTAVYASGASRTFAAETVEGRGHREVTAHLADLVAAREARKTAKEAQRDGRAHRPADVGAAFYLGAGRASPDSVIRGLPLA